MREYENGQINKCSFNIICFPHVHNKYCFHFRVCNGGDIEIVLVFKTNTSFVLLHLHFNIYLYSSTYCKKKYLILFSFIYSVNYICIYLLSCCIVSFQI